MPQPLFYYLHIGVCIYIKLGFGYMFQKIKYFLKAAESGSFSVAAREMYISPPALTKQIKLLEEELGGKLFVRTSQGVILTGLGQFASKKFSVISREMDDVIEEIQEYARDSKIRIKVGIFSALPVEELVSPLVTFLLGCYPQYQISAELLEVDEGCRMMRDGKLDMLLTWVNDQDNLEGFQCFSFGTQNAKVVVSLTHPWVMKEHITEEDLQGGLFYNYPMDSVNYSSTKDNHFDKQIPHKDIRTISNYSTIMMLLHQGEGFTVLPMEQEEAEHLHLKCFDYPGNALLYNTALLYRKNNAVNGLGKIAEDLAEEFDLVPR